METESEPELEPETLKIIETDQETEDVSEPEALKIMETDKETEDVSEAEALKIMETDQEVEDAEDITETNDSNKETESVNEKEDDEDEFFIDWDDTLYLPEPHLITEEAFNKHFSYEKYYHLLSSTKGRTHETAPIPQKENSENTPKKMLHEKLSALESPYLEDWEKMSGGRNDIFEDAATVLSSSTTMYELHTNYHLMSSVRSKISTIDSRDRRFHFWFLKEQGKNKISKIVESNEMKFKKLLKNIANEQVEYQQFLHNCAMAHPNEYVYLNANVRDFVMNKLSKSTQVLLQSTKRFFALKKTITISRPLVGPQVSLEFKFLKCLCPQVNIPSIKVFPVNTPLKTPKLMNTCSLEVEADVDAAVDNCSTVDAGFHIQADALLAILESLIIPSREWLIPLFVKQKECAPGTEQTEETVVVISKPYPRRSLTFRETNCMYYKQVLEEFLKTDKKFPEEVKDSSRSTDDEDETSETCVNLFTCGKHRLLVESRIDCADPATGETFSVNAKTEFQPFVGFEQFSLKELCEFWWTSKLANATQILCARIDPRNNCTRRIDSYTREVLCAPGCPYRPEVFFYHLSSLLDVLTDCPTGDYLLEHASGNNHIFLFEKKEKGFTTLETKYKDLLTGKRQLICEDPKVPQWLPVDMNIRPSHLPEYDIPWLFDLPRYNIEFHALGKRKQQQKQKPKPKQQQRQNKTKGITIKNHQKPPLQLNTGKRIRPTMPSHIRSAETEPLPPGIEPFPPGMEPIPPGLKQFSPSVGKYSPGIEFFPPGMEPLPPGTEPFPLGTEPPPPGVELHSPVFKIPVQYDDADFGDL